MPDLLTAIDRVLSANLRPVDLTVDLADGAGLAWLYDHGQVLERRDDERVAHVRVRLAAADLTRFRSRRARARAAGH